MKYRVTHTTKFSYSEAVPIGHNIVRLAPRQLPHQSVADFRLFVNPEPLDLTFQQDYFDNEVAYFSIDDPHRHLSITAVSEVAVDPIDSAWLNQLDQTEPWESVVQHVRGRIDPMATAALQYTFGSRYVDWFDDLAAFTAEIFVANRPVGEAVWELTHKIFQEFKFDNTATTLYTPISEVFENRHGVCQDFAHLQLACLRQLGLPARYVSGYLRTIPPPGKPRLVGADASHAWVSVYCGAAGWIDFDPTNDQLAGTDYVTVAWGRDYQDVCPVQGVITGGGNHKMQVSVDVEPF